MTRINTGAAADHERLPEAVDAANRQQFGIKMGTSARQLTHNALY